MRMFVLRRLGARSAWGGGVLALLMLLAPLAQAFDARQVYREAAPAVVYIQGAERSPSGVASGTGAIIRDDGYILTNAHVVTSASNRLPTIVVALRPETVTGDRSRDFARYIRAEIVARSDRFDLALLKIDVPQLLPALRLSTLERTEIGEDVIAIGHPGGGVPWTMTAGRLSGSSTSYQGRQGWDVFLTDAAINPGNSGGPLLDARGEIIGINTFIRREGKDGLTLTGLNFAIQSTTAMRWIEAELGADFFAKAPPPLSPSRPLAAPRPEADAERSDFTAFLDDLRRGDGVAKAPLPPLRQAVPPASPESAGRTDPGGLDGFLRELRP
jgi:S1-C subfamily serine protease